MSLSDYEYSNRKKRTKRDEFLGIMDEIMGQFCISFLAYGYEQLYDGQLLKSR